MFNEGTIYYNVILQGLLLLYDTKVKKRWPKHYEERIAPLGATTTHACLITYTSQTAGSVAVNQKKNYTCICVYEITKPTIGQAPSKKST